MSPPTSFIPLPKAEWLDEVEALKLENFELRLEIVRNKLSDITAQRDAYVREIYKTHGLTIGKDKIDIKTRAIVRAPSEDGQVK